MRVAMSVGFCSDSLKNVISDLLSAAIEIEIASKITWHTATMACLEGIDMADVRPCLLLTDLEMCND